MRLLAEMELFVELVKFRNFGRAAAALNITASTLSRRIAALERSLGVPLILRSTRTFHLTELGQEFFQQSKRLIAEATRVRDEIGESFTRVSGRLRAGAPSDLATTLLAPVFAQYCRENPSLSIEVVATQAQPDLSNDSLDVAFVVAHQTPLPDSSFSARHVGSFARMLYASKTYLKQRGTPARPQDLREHSCIRHIHVQGAEKLWNLHQGRRCESVILGGVAASNSIIVCSQAAREHLGIAMLPLHLASHPSFGAGLTRVLPEWEGDKAKVFALSASRVLPAKTEELILLVKAEFSRRLSALESVS